MDSLCFRCRKPVYFGFDTSLSKISKGERAERKTSLGKEWHRQCLTCEECGKILMPGQHAEHRGLPYCNIPCYQLLFGPKISGYGIASVSNNKFGNEDNWKKSEGYDSLEKKFIIEKLLQHNANVKLIDQLCYKEINGRLIFEGLLRVHWRVNQTLRIAPFSRLHKQPNGKASDQSPKFFFPVDQEEDDDTSAMDVLLKSPTSFQPDYDTVTTVRISSGDVTSVVVQTLLAKFRVRPDHQEILYQRVNENADKFGLFLLRKDGFERRLMPQERPLLDHLNFDDAKFLLKEKNADRMLTESVKDFMTVSAHMLQQMLRSLEEKETAEKLEIIEGYSKLKNAICKQLSIVTETCI